jgi:hypothetical protein
MRPNGLPPLGPPLRSTLRLAGRTGQILPEKKVRIRGLHYLPALLTPVDGVHFTDVGS